MDWITFSKEEIESDALPLFCVECGAPSTCHVSKTFEYAPDWAQYLIFLGLVPGIIACAITQRQMRVSCPLCPEHGRRWRALPFSLRLGWMIMPLGVAVGYGLARLASADTSVDGVMGGGLLSAVAWGIWVGVDFCGRSHVKAVRITTKEISFEGLSDTFVKAAKERRLGNTPSAVD